MREAGHQDVESKLDRSSTTSPSRPGRRRRTITLAVASAVLAPGVGVAAFRAVSRGAPAAEPPPLSALRALGPAPDDARFERALAPRELRFPEDHGPHPTFRNEWWSWTGNLDGPAGRRFGYQLTVFRSALAP